MREIDVDEILQMDEEHSSPKIGIKRMASFKPRSNSMSKPQSSLRLSSIIQARMLKRNIVRGSLNLRSFKRKTQFGKSRMELEKIKVGLKNVGFLDENVDATKEFFRQQIDNEHDYSERAKRIDERLQDFDTNYEVSELHPNSIPSCIEFYTEMSITS